MRPSIRGIRALPIDEILDFPLVDALVDYPFDGQPAVGSVGWRSRGLALRGPGDAGRFVLLLVTFGGRDPEAHGQSFWRRAALQKEKPMINGPPQGRSATNTQ